MQVIFVCGNDEQEVTIPASGMTVERAARIAADQLGVDLATMQVVRSRSQSGPVADPSTETVQDGDEFTLVPKGGEKGSR